MDTICKLFLLVGGIHFILGQNKDLVRKNLKLLSLSNGYAKSGTWRDAVFCPAGTKTSGFALSYKKEYGPLFDDVGVAGVRLKCSDPDEDSLARAILEKQGALTLEDKTILNNTTSSTIESTGSDHKGCIWSKMFRCPVAYYLVAFNQRVNGERNIYDDKAGVVNLEFVCRGPGVYGKDLLLLHGEAIDAIGSFAGEISDLCPLGSAICGVKPKTVDFRGDLPWQDDVGLTNIRFICCRYI